MRFPDLSIKVWLMIAGTIIAIIFLQVNVPTLFSDLFGGVWGCTRAITEIELDLDIQQIVPPGD